MIKIEEADKVQLKYLDVKVAEALFGKLLKLMEKATDDSQLSYDFYAYHKATAFIVRVIDNLKLTDEQLRQISEDFTFALEQAYKR